MDSLCSLNCLYIDAAVHCTSSSTSSSYSTSNSTKQPYTHIHSYSLYFLFLFYRLLYSFLSHWLLSSLLSIWHIYCKCVCARGTTSGSGGKRHGRSDAKNRQCRLLSRALSVYLILFAI